ncbi:MAG: hypothetical protein NVS4B12_14740 [Ktedonobacteraceae bacterium]
MDISEKKLEETIEQVLLAQPGVTMLDATNPYVRQSRPLYGSVTSNLVPKHVAPGGYRKHISADYDREHCLIAEDVLNFLYATQPKEWATIFSCIPCHSNLSIRTHIGITAGIRQG